jgi:hypothetical protein
MSKQQKIEITTNGKWRGTKVIIDGNPISCEALTVSGSKAHDLDIVLTLSLSKVSEDDIKSNCGRSGENAVGFHVPNDFDVDDDE